MTKDGSDFLKSFVEATGLPDDFARKELERLTIAAGKNIQTLNINDLRLILASYLQDVLLGAREEYSADL